MALSKDQIAFRNRNLLFNLRYRWEKELAKYNDDALIKLYDAFAVSDMDGDNDAKFLEFIGD